MFMGLWAGAWVDSQGPLFWRKLTLPPQEIINSSSRRNGICWAPPSSTLGFHWLHHVQSQPMWVHVCNGTVTASKHCFPAAYVPSGSYCLFSWVLQWSLSLPWKGCDTNAPTENWACHSLLFSMCWPIMGIDYHIQQKDISLMKARKHSSRSLGENQITTILLNQVSNKASHILILTIPLFCWKKKSPLYKMPLPKCIMPVVEISATCFSKNIQRVFFKIQFIWGETWLGSEIRTNHSAIYTFVLLILNYDYDTPTQEI